MTSISNKAIAAAGLVLTALVCCAGPGATLGTLPDCETGVCPPESVDPFVPSDASVDSETSAVAKLCIDNECPPPFATCDGNKFICQTNLLTDSNNCGACGNVCPPFYSVHVTTACVDGQCVPICQPTFNTYRDCNSVPDDGCEADIDHDPNNCGACGNKCPADKPCGVHTIGLCGCPNGLTLCDGKCVDLSSTWDHCGSCGNKCVVPDAGPLPPHMDYFCTGGECAVPDCKSEQRDKWADCNNDKKDLTGDGCEVNIGPNVRDPNNCGACGRTCPAGQTCEAMGDGSWVDCACPAPLQRCNVRNTVVCADLSNDPWNCGNCGHACEANASGSTETASCIDGICVRKCVDGYADCNGIDGDSFSSPGDACETDIHRDPHNCGGCGVACESGQPCIDGHCLMKECDAGIVAK